MNQQDGLVLLIDDEEVINFLHLRLLKKLGLEQQTQVCENGAQAIELLKKVSNQPSISIFILLDVNMPVLDGWEFLLAFQELPERLISNTAIVMLSSSVSPEDKLKADQNPLVREYCHKPMTLGKLESLIEQYLLQKADL